MLRQPPAVVSATWGVVALLWPLQGSITSGPCNGPEEQIRIARALDQIATRVDPCGESPRVQELLEKVRRCRAATYQICIDVTAERNWFDRPDEVEPHAVRTIKWNPSLHNELEPACDDGSNQPVLRDPIASLLHELAHAAQDCDGLNPAEHEFEAVRIENIYRRAAGLCQRSKYGDDRLPNEMLKSCAPGNCSCTVSSRTEVAHVVTDPPTAEASPADERAAHGR